MKRKIKYAASGLMALALAGAGVGIAAAATGEGDAETPITGEALTKASAAALAETRGGRVTETEAGDEDAYYEVEVTLDDGRQVDVHLDRDFKVVSTKVDRDEPNDQGR